MLSAPAAAPEMKRGSTIIVCSPHTIFVAKLMARELEDAGFNVTIATDPGGMDRFEHRFVVAPHMFHGLAEGFVAVQLEQLQDPVWDTPSYMALLNKADAIIDYSLANIAKLAERGFPYHRLYWVPFGILPGHNDHALETAKSTDVLFYGAINSERRQRLFAEIRKHFNLEVASSTFGPEMERLIRSAKVVVNLHFYDNARLETTRIYECLSLGTPVISERTDDTVDYPDLERVVDFVPTGDAQALCDRIASLLGNPTIYADRLAALRSLAAGSEMWVAPRYRAEAGGIPHTLDRRGFGRRTH
jgi:hypothetical protein